MTFFKTEHRRVLSMLMTVLMVLTMMATSMVAPISAFAEDDFLGELTNGDKGVTFSPDDADQNVKYDGKGTLTLTLDEITTELVVEMTVDLSPSAEGEEKLSHDNATFTISVVGITDDNRTYVTATPVSGKTDVAKLTIKVTEGATTDDFQIVIHASDGTSTDDLTLDVALKATAYTYGLGWSLDNGLSSSNELSEEHPEIEVTLADLLVWKRGDTTIDELTKELSDGNLVVNYVLAAKKGSETYSGAGLAVEDGILKANGAELPADTTLDVVVTATLTKKDGSKFLNGGGLGEGKTELTAELKFDIKNTVEEHYKADVTELELKQSNGKKLSSLIKFISLRSGEEYEFNELSDSLTGELDGNIEHFVSLSTDGSTLMITPTNEEVTGNLYFQFSKDGTEEVPDLTGNILVYLNKGAGPQYTITVTPTEKTYVKEGVSPANMTDLELKVEIKYGGESITLDSYELTYELSHVNADSQGVAFGSKSTSGNTTTIPLEYSTDASSDVYTVTINVNSLTLNGYSCLTADSTKQTVKFTVVGANEYQIQKFADVQLSSAVKQINLLDSVTIAKGGEAMAAADVKALADKGQLWFTLHDGEVSYSDYVELSGSKLTLIKDNLSDSDLTFDIFVHLSLSLDQIGENPQSATLTIVKKTVTTGGGDTSGASTTAPSNPSTPGTTEPEPEPEIPEVVVEMDPVTAETGEDGKAVAEVDAKAMDEAIAEAIAEAEAENGAPVVSIPVEVDDEAVDLEVVLPTASVEKLAAAANSALKVTSRIGDVKLSHTALVALADEVGENDTIVLEINTGVDAVAESLNEAQLDKIVEIVEKLGEEAEAEIFDVSLYVNDEPMHDFNNGAIEVSVPYELPASVAPTSIRVYYLAEDGTLERCKDASYADGRVTFTTYHLSKYIISTMSLTAEFEDVAESDWFYDAVMWAYENGVTTGKTNTEFDPYDGCTRAQFVTFLWRAAGYPEPTTTECAFTDVENAGELEPYYKAILWAAENGIALGTDAEGTTFSPKTVVLRGQALLFMCRYAAQNNIGVEPVTPNFTDVQNEYPVDAYYDAIGWAVANGITNGLGNGLFGPLDACERGQMVTFLYRMFTDATV